MTNGNLAPLATWLTDPVSREVSQSVDLLRRSDDIQQVALMPDVHLAREVCVGAVVATECLIYPAAVGGDIGCGMLSLAFDAEAEVIDDQNSAARILAGLYEHVPANKHRAPKTFPDSLMKVALTDPRLQRLAAREGRVQLGTLGRGNHFLEFQSDLDQRLWVMIHSGSRAMGQAIIDHHVKDAVASSVGLKALHSTEEAGLCYLSDAEWARTYARENRLAMLEAVIELVHRLFRVTADWDTLIHCDHNHVQQESHAGKKLWVHRKGAQSAQLNEPGIVPGSMGAASFHTSGRGCEDALMSCSHGAGRRLSRMEARRQLRLKDFERQVGGLWYDHRKASKLKDEAPSVYKNIRHVMRAQRDLARIVRELRPVLTYKAH